MHPQELARRRRVWEALSEVFLDTETRWYFPRVAGVLVDAGYTREERERIWRWEMVPECAGNLSLVAGAWAALALDEPALIRRASTDPGLLAKAFGRKPDPFLSSQWQQIQALCAALERQPAEARPRLVQAWTAFARGYLEESLDQCLWLEDTVASLRSCGLSRPRCAETFAIDFRPAYAELLLANERPREEARARNVLELIRRAG